MYLCKEEECEMRTGEINPNSAAGCPRKPGTRDPWMQQEEGTRDKTLQQPPDTDV